MSPSTARGGVFNEHEDADVLVLIEETMTTSGSTSSGVQQGGQVWPRVQFRQMAEMNLDATAMEELTRM
eukprot:12353611-Prorocentrum_lima.AAC.1